MEKKRLAYVDYWSHQYTKSGDFLREILSEEFEITDFWWKPNNKIPLNEINKFEYIFFLDSDTEIIQGSIDNFLDKIKNRKIWCAASTHPLEEIFCAKTHLMLKKNYNNILTIIIPRHVDRIKTINEELSNLNLTISLFSKLDQININTDILLIDSYGETSKFYNISKCVLLGKSLIKSPTNGGGQNPIEPSRLGCKIFHGPNVSNFAEIYEYLKSLGVAEQVSSPEELIQSLDEEFKEDKTNNNHITEKIDNYGLNILNNVIKEIKIYINT